MKKTNLLLKKALYAIIFMFKGEVVMKYKYNKLVRDKIPQNIRAKGHDVKHLVLDDKEYFEELDKKLIEEVNEFVEVHNEEEMADIMEVIEAIIKQRGMSLKQIQEIKQKKREKSGSFNDKIFLVSIKEKDKNEENKDNNQEER